MELDLRGVVAPAAGEVLAEEVEVQEEWEERGPEQDLAGIVSVHPVVTGYPIRQAFHAMK